MSTLLNAEATCNVLVQFDEVDSFRIVHHTRLVAYLERARLLLFRDRAFDTSERGPAAVVYTMRLDFKKPARLLEELRVSSRVEAVEACKLVLSERVTRGKDLLMKSRTEIVFVDPADGIPLPVEGVIR